jgi:hypothetical protein
LNRFLEGWDILFIPLSFLAPVMVIVRIFGAETRFAA